MKGLGHSLTMQCELWLLDGPDPDVAMMTRSCALVGLLSVPLGLRVLESGNAVLAHDIFWFRNVLDGFFGAKAGICITTVEDVAALLNDVLPCLVPVEGPLSHLDKCNAGGAADSPAQNSTQEHDQAQDNFTAAVWIINHEFKVHILSIQQLPSSEQASDHHRPVARYLKCGPSGCGQSVCNTSL